MSGGLREASQLLTRLKTEPYSGIAAGVDEFLQARVMAFFGDADMVEAAQTRAKRLLDGMQPVQNVHPSSLSLILHSMVAAGWVSL